MKSTNGKSKTMHVGYYADLGKFDQQESKTEKIHQFGYNKYLIKVLSFKILKKKSTHI